MDGASEVLAGALGGTACVVTGQPFDTIKTKVQTFPHVYRNVVTGVRKTFAESGLRGYYSGSLPAILAATGENAVLFLAYSKNIGIVSKTFGVNREYLRPWHHGYAGGMSAVFTALVVCPAEIVKCRLQVQRQMPARDSTSVSNRGVSIGSIARSVYKQDGMRGFFRGLTATWGRDIPGYFVFFTSKFAVENALRKSNLQLSESATVIIAGGTGGCCLWAAVFPFDVIKSRIQVKASPHLSIGKTFFNILANEGPLALYKGITPALVRSFPANASLWLAYDSSKRYLDGFFSTSATCTA